MSQNNLPSIHHQQENIVFLAIAFKDYDGKVIGPFWISSDIYSDVEEEESRIYRRNVYVSGRITVNRQHREGLDRLQRSRYIDVFMWDGNGVLGFTATDLQLHFDISSVGQMNCKFMLMLSDSKPMDQSAYDHIEQGCKQLAQSQSRIEDCKKQGA